ncbi:hypothetical protein D6T65_15730 [Arthrobacter frigidicola]|nr:hypothetical protein D6T65_15730 [Arthrobacter frigidicola]
MRNMYCHNAGVEQILQPFGLGEEYMDLLERLDGVEEPRLVPGGVSPAPTKFLRRTRAAGEYDVEQEQVTQNRDAQRDHEVAEQQPAAVARGDFKNDVDTQGSAADAEELWHSGDRRAALADTLMTQLSNGPASREGVEAFLAASLSDGAPPSASVLTTRRSFQGRPKTLHNPTREKGLRA